MPRASVLLPGATTGFSGPINFNFTTPLNFFGVPPDILLRQQQRQYQLRRRHLRFHSHGSYRRLSPFFGDVDTRTSAGVLHIRTDIANQVILTWDHVGFFDSHATSTNSFQLVVRGPDYDIPVGEGTIGFFYKDMGWEDTDTSNVAAVGFGDGLGNGVVLDGSVEPGLIGVLANHHIWFDVNLEPVPGPGSSNGVPAPASLILLGLGLTGFAVLRRRLSA